MARAKLKDSIKYCAFADSGHIAGREAETPLVVVTTSGKHCVFEIPQKGGHCALKECRNYLAEEDNEE